MNKKKLNNNGFSLVELIIVIAIMAVLVGVLAPQFIGYVEKSKRSNDVSTIDSIANALDTLAIDPAVTWTDTKIQVSSSGMTLTPSTGDFATELKTIIPNAKLKGSWGTVTLDVSKDANGKVVYDSSNFSHEIFTYSEELKNRME